MYSDYGAFSRFSVNGASTVTVARVFMTPMCVGLFGAKTKGQRASEAGGIVNPRGEVWYYTIFDVERVPSGMAAVN